MDPASAKGPELLPEQWWDFPLQRHWFASTPKPGHEPQQLFERIALFATSREPAVVRPLELDGGVHDEWHRSQEHSEHSVQPSHPLWAHHPWEAAHM